MPSLFLDEMQDSCSSDELVVRTDSQSNVASLASLSEQEEVAIWKEVLLRRCGVCGQ